MTDIDPFADVPADDTAESITTPTDIDPKENKNNMTTSNDSQNNLTVTLKGGSGFDAPWIVIHAGTPQDAIDVLNTDTMKHLTELTQKVAGKFAGMGPAKAAPAQNSNGQPQGAQQAPAGAPDCPPGWTFRSGVSKASGKPYKGFFPPRGDDSKPIFFQ